MIKLIIPVNDDLITPGLPNSYPRTLSNNELKVITFYGIDNIDNTNKFVQDVLEYIGYIPLGIYTDSNDWLGLYDRHNTSISLLTIALELFIYNLKITLKDIIGFMPTDMQYIDDLGCNIIIGIPNENN